MKKCNCCDGSRPVDACYISHCITDIVSQCVIILNVSIHAVGGKDKDDKKDTVRQMQCIEIYIEARVHLIPRIHLARI